MEGEWLTNMNGSDPNVGARGKRHKRKVSGDSEAQVCVVITDDMMIIRCDPT